MRELDARFDRQVLVYGPYFFPDLADVSESEEQATIDAGEILAIASVMWASGGSCSALVQNGRRPPRPVDKAEWMACWISVDVLAIELGRTQRQQLGTRSCNVLDHDVQVDLLGHRRSGPGGWRVIWSTLECQARRRVAGGGHNPIVVTVCHRQPQQRGVERGQGIGVWAV